jgi:hypothetical protein
MTSIPMLEAAQVVDQFEGVLANHGIDIPRHSETGADMLSFWKILKWIKENGLRYPGSEEQELFRAALAVHDLAVKVLSVSGNIFFPRLIEHLRLLSKGAVHLTQVPPADSDVYNKLIELYWACLLLSCGVGIKLDPPIRGSDGTNPDVITLDGSSSPMNGYAFKTIRSPHTESIRSHIVKGVDQIEASAAPTGIVGLHLTPRLAWGTRWPDDHVFEDHNVAAYFAIDQMRAMVGAVIADNGQQEIDRIFAGKKAVGHVLCIAFLPTIAISPETGRPTFMPIKISTVFSLASSAPLPHSLYLELWCANEVMQRKLQHRSQ